MLALVLKARSMDDARAYSRVYVAVASTRLADPEEGVARLKPMATNASEDKAALIERMAEAIHSASAERQ